MLLKGNDGLIDKKKAIEILKPIEKEFKSKVQSFELKFEKERLYYESPITMKGQAKSKSK